MVRNSFACTLGFFLGTGFIYRRFVRYRAWYARIPFIVIGGLCSFSAGFSIGRMWRDDIAAIQTAIKYEK